MTALMRMTVFVLCWQDDLNDALTRRLDRRRDERGLSQSTETALLVAGAVVVAALIITAVTALVKSKLDLAAGNAVPVGQVGQP